MRYAPLFSSPFPYTGASKIGGDFFITLSLSHDTSPAVSIVLLYHPNLSTSLTCHVSLLPLFPPLSLSLSLFNELYEMKSKPEKKFLRK